MKAPLIAGLIFAGLGALLSMLANNWQVSLVLSGSIGIISIFLISLLRNALLIMNTRAKARKEEKKSFEEGEKFIGAIGMFGLPNIIIAVILYFKLYR